MKSESKMQAPNGETMGHAHRPHRVSTANCCAFGAFCENREKNVEPVCGPSRVDRCAFGLRKYRVVGEIPLRCACGISVPSRGVLATMLQPTTCRSFALFPSSVVVQAKLVRRRPTKQPGAKALGCNWLRRERDSNSRYPFGVHTLSRRASSATRASLQYGPRNKAGLQR